jgi:hypothetical protein
VVACWITPTGERLFAVENSVDILDSSLLEKQAAVFYLYF